MGKDKKNKKGKQEEDFGEEEVEKQVIVDEKPGKKAKKGKAKEVDDSDEEVISKKKEPVKSKKKYGDSDDDVDEVANHRGKDEPQEKKNKKKGKKAEVLSDDDNEEQSEKKSNKKKGKKNEILSDDELDDQPEKKNKKKGKKIASEDEASDNEAVSNKKSKSAPKGKKEAKEKKVRVKDRKDESSDEEEVSNKPQANKRISAFALLDVEDMDIDMGQSSDEEESKEVAVPKANIDDKKSKKSKKKDRKKKQDDDDEDLEKMFEELALEKEGKKPAAPKEKEKTAVEDNKAKPEDEAITVDATKSSVKAKKGKKNEQVKEKEDDDKDDGEELDGVEDDEAGGTVKTAAQKKKEKKERERLKKIAMHATVKTKKDAGSINDTTPKPPVVVPASEKEATPIPEAEDDDKDEDDDEKSSKKKKKKGKGVVEDDKATKKKPGKKQLAAMQEALKKMKEEEEKARLEEEAKEQAAQKAEEERLEKLQLEQERKDKKKQKEKEKKERLKAEGKLLTKAQKQAKARAEASLLALRQLGVAVPQIGEKIERAPRLGDRRKPLKKKTDETAGEKTQELNGNVPQVQVKIADSTSSSKDSSPEIEEVKESWEDGLVVEKVEEIKETWDESSEDESKVKKESSKVVETKVLSPAKKAVKEPVKNEKKDESEDEDDDDDEDLSDEESSDDDDEESEGSEDDRNLRQSERVREKVLNRIHKRKEENEKNISMDKLRSPVVCVLGHVDTGKTKILDKIRNTHVQDGEAGGITQQIGATMVPNFALKDQCKMVKNFVILDLKLPGLLIIDTPGHESFSNLRSRGSSLCDIAILVVDIMHGLEPQTIESLNMLKQRKTPFVVALNKIDRLYEWKSNKNKDVQDVIRSQQQNTKLEFGDRTKEIILQFNEQGLNAALCYENKDPRTYVSLVPTSAFSGDGMGNLLGLVVELSQSMLAKRLSFSEELQATVLEVKAIPGLGTTIDVILVNGRLREGDTVVLAGHEGAVVTQIRSLLMPQPMKELRVKNPYQEFKEVEAAQGVKIAGKDLDKAIAGLQLLVANHPDEVDILKEEVSRSLKEVMNAIKLSERGVYVQASTLGSLEALLEFLRTSKIPYSGIRIGPVVKKDVMKSSIMLEHDNQYAVILAFDVKIERDAQELADNLGVKIFQANIIYHLFDSFTKYREDLMTKKRNEFKNIAVFPCKLRILPQFIFNSRDPIVIGVSVEAGVIKEGTPLCVPSRENLEIGIVTTIEINHKTVETAKKGQEVCIKIEPLGGDAPKMYGRHFDNTDILVSKITRQSIDACKDYFRDDLSKTDWQLMVELKKMFQIL